MLIAVLGSRGRLGGAVVREFQSHHDVIAFDHAALDIASPAEVVAAALARVKPDVIINCAGYNAVDAAEDHPLDALRPNAFALRTLARETTKLRAVLVHYSSDFVFDGTSSEPYTEDHHPNPQSVYATSKMLGEWFASDASCAYVLRVESLFGRRPDGTPIEGSVATILHGLKSGTAVKVFEDRIVSPTYVADAVRATRELIERRAPAGIYHCVNSGRCTWLEFALEAARLMGVEPRLERIMLDDVKLKAARPRYCALSNAKLASTGIEMPAWRDALEHHVSECWLQKSSASP
jgi:dTDP-4-dehydrorhamnose reductase